MDPLSVVLPGTWKLISRIDRSHSGERRVEPSLGEDPVALLFYDRSGNFAAQFMKRDRTTPISDVTVSASNNSRAQGGYDAYFGTYMIDDAEKTVSQRLVGALSKENVGMVVTRRMLVEGDTLTIKLETTSAEGEAVIRTLIWSRVS
jgi:Lipocalin-like domain